MVQEAIGSVHYISPEQAKGSKDVYKRQVQEARDRGMVVDGTYGRRTRAVLIMDSDHVVLSALQPETCLLYTSRCV